MNTIYVRFDMSNVVRLQGQAQKMFIFNIHRVKERDRGTHNDILNGPRLT